MIIEKEKLKLMEYPVGLNIEYNLPIINEYIKIIRRLKKDKIELICTGSSGAIIAGIIASKLKCKVIYVRKEKESCHTSHGASPSEDAYTIVVDDFVCSGNSIKRILDNYPDKQFDCLIVSGHMSQGEICFDPEDFDVIFCRKFYK